MNPSCSSLALKTKYKAHVGPISTACALFPLELPDERFQPRQNNILPFGLVSSIHLLQLSVKLSIPAGAFHLEGEFPGHRHAVLRLALGAAQSLCPCHLHCMRRKCACGV